jgi:plastocyanin
MLLAVAALAVMACGGERPPAGDPASGNVVSAGVVHDVDMVYDGTDYRFVPADLTIKAGDIVRYHNRSGGPHNVAFWEDSIPQGAAQVLQGAMPNQMTPLAGEMVVTPDATYEISFAGAPAGVYRYYCLPHLQLGMVAMVTVEP